MTHRPLRKAQMACEPRGVQEIFRAELKYHIKMKKIIFIKNFEIKNDERINIEFQQIFDSNGNLEQLKIIVNEKTDSELKEKKDENKI